MYIHVVSVYTKSEYKPVCFRKVNGESRVFEESYSSGMYVINLHRQCIIYSILCGVHPSVGSVTSDLSELSLTSATSSEPDSPRGGRGPLRGSVDHSAPHRTQCKSCTLLSPFN